VVAEIRIYFEGDKKLREGFHVFLADIIDKARARRVRVELIATGGTPEKDYQIAVRAHPGSWNVLVRDSEGPLPSENHDSKFWMVQVMETWFLADPERLEGYYGDGFKKAALKANRKIEEIPKADVLACLKQATKGCKAGEYHKTKHAPMILKRIDPTRVRKVAPNCARLFTALLAALD